MHISSPVSPTRTHLISREAARRRRHPTESPRKHSSHVPAAGSPPHPTPTPGRSDAATDTRRRRLRHPTPTPPLAVIRRRTRPIRHQKFSCAEKRGGGKGRRKKGRKGGEEGGREKERGGEGEAKRSRREVKNTSGLPPGPAPTPDADALDPTPTVVSGCRAARF